MESLVQNAMIGATGAARAQLIGAASRYITDNNFVNLLQNIDINAPKKFNYGMLRAFDAVPGLAIQVRAWLAAGR